MVLSGCSIIIVLQIVMFLLFLIFGRYDQNYNMEEYPLFQDIHVMVFIGFGFLMTFLRRYAFSALGFNFLVGALMLQWSIICRGFYNLNSSYQILINMESLLNADITTCSVLISMGVILGTTTYLQLLIMGMLEVIFFSVNVHIMSNLLKVCDTGGSVVLHTFGAYYGIAVSFVLGRARLKMDSENETSRYNSDLFTMIGTIFMWLYWPSFNAIGLPNELKYRAIVNTYLSLASCCVSTFGVSSWLDKNRKFEMVHIQNSTLAGGVAIGSSVSLLVQPYGALLIGMSAGILSAIGFAKLTPWIASEWKIHDTCGVHNLHGMPGILGGLIGTFMASLATEEDYGALLYDLYPARYSNGNTNFTVGNYTETMYARGAVTQAVFQFISIIVTVSISLVTGLITGFLINSKKIQLESDQFFVDTPFWKTKYGFPLLKSPAPIQVQSKPQLQLFSTDTDNY